MWQDQRKLVWCVISILFKIWDVTSFSTCHILFGPTVQVCTCTWIYILYGLTLCVCVCVCEYVGACVCVHVQMCANMCRWNWKWGKLEGGSSETLREKLKWYGLPEEHYMLYEDPWQNVMWICTQLVLKCIRAFQCHGSAWLRSNMKVTHVTILVLPNEHLASTTHTCTHTYTMYWWQLSSEMWTLRCLLLDVSSWESV